MHRVHPAPQLATVFDIIVDEKGIVEHFRPAAALYREFTDALTEVLAENAVGPERRGRLARARAAVKKTPSVQ
jgi:hypothetical protein